MTWLIFSEFAVHFGFLGAFFPTMVWPIFLSISLIDNDFLEASNDLGARRFRTLVHIILPLALPGVVAGFVFTFIPMLGDTVVAQHMGGNNVLMLSAQVQEPDRSLQLPWWRPRWLRSCSPFMLAFQVLLWAALRPVGGLNEVFANLRR